MSDRSRVRIVVLQILVLSLFVTLLGRLWYLQIPAGERYDQAASANQVREIVTPAVRGQILDHLGRPLVNNRPALVVSVSRTELLKQPDKGRAVLQRLAKVLGMPYEELRQRISLCGPNVPKPCWNGSPYQPIPVTDEADTRMALQIMERREDFPGVTAEVQPVRNYPAPEGANAAHILGYLSPVSEDELRRQREPGYRGPQYERSETVGRAGLEREYNDQLRGQPGVTRVAVDHLGRVIDTLDETPPTPGNHLVTSIDARVQAVAEQQLLEAIKRARQQRDKDGKAYKADSGAVVVMNAKNGQIVAMASYPTYDPAVWEGGITKKEYERLISEDTGVPMLSRATMGEFAPASTFKVISTAAALEAGYGMDQKFDCSSSYTVGNRAFKNWDSKAFGPITLARSLTVSCDTVYYRIAHEMWLKDGGTRPVTKPKDYMINMAQAFGLGQKTGIDLPAERPGRVVTREWKKREWERRKDGWCRQANDPKVPEGFAKQIARENCADYYRYRAGDAVNFSIGQGDTVATPLQIARVYAAVANGGTLWRPTIGKAIVSPSGQVVEWIKPQGTKVPVDPKYLAYIRKGLMDTPVNGTAVTAFQGWPFDKIPVAAKTGTGEAYGKQTTAWFASFVPANDPQYVVVMVVSQGGQGSRTPGPSVAALERALMGVQPDGAVDPAKALIPGVKPPAKLPTIRPDGVVVQPKPAPTTTGTGSPSPQALAAEPVVFSRPRAIGKGGRAWS
ncbi:Cell division protein FtsI (Peptidoglycan synthetase) [Carbonactinospora thermoautotrophica]|uniref:Cell division protein FtsI (Peptidoglycan synthetase) n=1 Tax=Carbonactinospora thermoautotrophica TaxID=1469144 RepID=A0A132MVZ0_9ACTN|nr:penicillin-binding protein 2 [Carbonactinospora thermoautotrophica]KWX02021.1 Cell division protein FtsI (Peptidoglycan synthetase) [Carbonactinospora thermoautotrophica]